MEGHDIICDQGPSFLGRQMNSHFCPSKASYEWLLPLQS
jgi:hypothetical protein